MAFFILNMLSDAWEGMSGTYMGKSWIDAEHLFKLYEVEEPKAVMYFAKMYERVLVEYRAEESEKKRKAEERRSSAGSGKNFTHNVRG